MISALVFIAIWLAFALALYFLVLKPNARPVPPPKPYLDRQIHKTVTVHTTNGDSISGALAENFPSGVLLKGARYLDTENPVPLGGEVFIPSAKVNFIQGGTDA